MDDCVLFHKRTYKHTVLTYTIIIILLSRAVMRSHTLSFSEQVFICCDMAIRNEDMTSSRGFNDNLFFSQVTLTEWHEESILPLIDLRPYHVYDLLPIRSIKHVVINIPLSTIQSGERSCELPPRYLEFAVVCEKGEQPLMMKIFGASVSAATNQTREPWKVRLVIVADNFMEDEVHILRLYKHDCSSSNFPFARLFYADPMIEHQLVPKLAQNYDQQYIANNDDKIPWLYRIYDLGCGSGRDVAVLSEVLLAHHNLNYPKSHARIKVIGIDNHKGSPQKSKSLWKRRGVESISDSILLNLKKLDELDEIFQRSTPNCVYSVRYLNRPLLKYLSKNLPTGTIFAMSHFCKTNQFQTWDFDHPKVQSVLEREELRNTFEGWNVEYDDIVLDSDHGRTLINFIATRK